ncbi:hypothetical protein ACHZ97_19010 [Lysobacter soli]|uniref:hypothetical protein n=1 Tax=Lysobacter soli TaxID=453783 RepID=UPI0037CC1851
MKTNAKGKAITCAARMAPLQRAETAECSALRDANVIIRGAFHISVTRTGVAPRGLSFAFPR